MTAGIPQSWITASVVGVDSDIKRARTLEEDETEKRVFLREARPGEYQALDRHEQSTMSRLDKQDLCVTV